MGRKSKPKLRRHAPDSPDVPDLVHPGDWIRSSYETGGIVVRVIESFFYVDDEIGSRYSSSSVARSKSIFSGTPSYTIQFISKQDVRDNSKRININMLSFYNEVVAVDGKLCELFLANKDSYEIIPVPKGIEISAKIRKFIEIKNKLHQLELFKMEWNNITSEFEVAK